MTSKYQLKSNTLYYPNTEVSINKFSIKDAETIQELEKELLEEAYEIFYNELDDNTLFDEYYFKQLHLRTFESLYDWAGQYRGFNMAKGGSRFCQGAYIQASSHKIFLDLKNNNFLKDYSDKPKADFAKKLAYFKCEINTLHPFYELNGRITRMFFDMIAVFNGYQFIDYSTISSEEYINSAIECVQFADSTNLEKIIFKGLVKV